jgi:hypothetical protein
VPEQLSSLTPTALSDVIRFERILSLACKFNADAFHGQTTKRIAELDGECHRHIGPATTLAVDLRHADDGASLLVTVFRDKGNPVTSDWLTLTPGWHHLGLTITRASQPDTFDGQIECWLDGAKQAPIPLINLYWRHYPTFVGWDLSVVDKLMTHVGPTIPLAFLGPVIRRRHVRRRR